MEPRDTYTKNEAAARLGVSYSTLHNVLIKGGKLRTVKAGSRVLIPRAALEAFLQGDSDRQSA